jgi:hemolysin-activating ACP:hemolysin acyltransferase
MAFWPKKADDNQSAGVPQPTVAERNGSLATPGAHDGFAATPVAEAPPAAPRAATASPGAPSNQMARFGEIVSILMRSNNSKHQSLADLEWMVIPALTTGQYSLAEAQMKSNGQKVPVGVVLWASVSPGIDQRLSEASNTAVRLKPDEWATGDIVWLIDAIGEHKVIQAMLKQLTNTRWKDKRVRFKSRGADGKFAVGTLALVPT